MLQKGIYRLFLTALLFCCVHVSSAQTEASLNALLDVCDAVYASLPDSSYAIALSAEKQSVKKFPKVEARAHSKKARYLLLKSDLEAAEKELNTALKMYADLNDLVGQGYVMKLKAILQGRIGNDKEQLECLERSVELYKEANDKSGVVNVELNLVLSYIDMEDAKATLAILNDLKASEDLLSGSTKYFYYQNWSKYYYLIKDYASAIANADIAAGIAKEYDMKDSYITILTLKAQIRRTTNDYAAAEKLLLEAEQLCLSGSLDHELDEAYAELVKVYTAKGAYDKAFYYLKRQNELKQKMYNIEKVNSINSLEKKLKLSQTEKELAQQKLQVEHEQLKYQQTRSQVTILLFVIVICLLIAGLMLFLYFRTKSLKDQISEQKQSIEEKSKIIEESYRNIKDSIVYSKQLQDATLPTDRLFRSHFPQSFIYYCPKDIVAGDFYWLERVGDRLFFAVADCTGHGVPGALVSVVCNNALNRAVKELRLTDPGMILDKVRELVIENFAKSEREVKDGMDIALCCFEYNAKRLLELKYAGANNPLWIFRKNKDYKNKASKALGFDVNPTLDEEYNMIELVPNKQSVGMSETFFPFVSHSLELQSGDVIYAFTDGITDQFGGKEGKKLKRSNFKKILLSLQERSILEQHIALHNIFNDWKTGYEQVDDVCVIGVKI